MEKERSVGVTMFGWLLIAYFVYAFLYPIVASIILAVSSEMPKSPIGSYGFMKASGVNTALLNIYTISAFTQMATPIFSFLGGIGILRLKEWARKFILVIFAISVISQLIVLSTTLTTPFLKRAMFSKQFGVLSFCLLFGFDILVIYFFTRPKVKKQFN